MTYYRLDYVFDNFPFNTYHESYNEAVLYRQDCTSAHTWTITPIESTEYNESFLEHAAQQSKEKHRATRTRRLEDLKRQYPGMPF